MTRHGSTRTRPPYQATTISQSATQLQQAALQRLRNPWIPGDCQSTTNSSSSSRTYHGIPSDGVSSPIYHSPLPEEQSQFDNILPELDTYYSHNPPQERKPYLNDNRQYYRNENEIFSGRVYPEDSPERRFFNYNERAPENEALCQMRYSDIDNRQKEFFHTRNYLDEHGRLAYQQPYHLQSSQRNSNIGRPLAPTLTSGSASERAQSPGSLTGRGAVEGCGGHCIAFQNFCYYFLQVIFFLLLEYLKSENLIIND